MGSRAIFRTRLTLSRGISIFSAISSGVGSRPRSWTRYLEVLISLLIVSIIWTGILMVRAWSAIALVMAWRIHQVAYVLNLYPRRYSNLSTAFIRPIFPSWIRSRNCRPLLVYFFAILTTNLKLALISSALARFAFALPRSMRLDIFLRSLRLQQISPIRFSLRSLMSFRSANTCKRSFFVYFRLFRTHSTKSFLSCKCFVNSETLDPNREAKDAIKLSMALYHEIWEYIMSPIRVRTLLSSLQSFNLS